MDNQQKIDEALEKYSELKRVLGKTPSSREFRKVYPERALASLFTGGSAYSKLQKLAGDNPNIFSSEKSDWNKILVKWGKLARKTIEQHNKLPVSSDWAHYQLRPSVSGIEQSHKISWSDMPSLFQKCFYKNPDWEDVLSSIPSSDLRVLAEANNEECFVYLMKDLRNNAYKIGISANPLKRERTLQSEQPKIKLLAVKKYINRKIALAFEKALHNIYSHKRKRGEWFNLDSEDVNELRATLDDKTG